MSTERPRRRRTILTALGKMDLAAMYVEARGSEKDARRTCWSAMVPQLCELGISQLWIERQQGIERDDRISIRDALEKAHSLGRLAYGHKSPYDEELLWLADAIAWASGAGGVWARLVNDVLVR